MRGLRRGAERSEAEWRWPRRALRTPPWSCRGREHARRGPLGGEHGRGAHPERRVGPPEVVVLAPVADHDAQSGSKLVARSSGRYAKKDFEARLAFRLVTRTFWRYSAV